MSESVPLDGEVLPVGLALPINPDEYDWGEQQWKADFLRALSVMPNATAAARAAGVHKSTAYYARYQDEVFSRLWAEAIDQAADVLERYAWEMSTQGIESTETHTKVRRVRNEDGQLVIVEEVTNTITGRRVSPHLTAILLSAYRPEKFRRATRLEMSGPEGAPIAFTITKEEADAAVDGFRSTVVRLADARRAADGSESGGKPKRTS